MTMITPSYLGETIEYSSLHACRSTLEDPTPAELLEPATPKACGHESFTKTIRLGAVHYPTCQRPQTHLLDAALRHRPQPVLLLCV